MDVGDLFRYLIFIIALYLLSIVFIFSNNFERCLLFPKVISEGMVILSFSIKKPFENDPNFFLYWTR